MEATLLFAEEILNLINQIHLSQEMSPATLIDLEGIQDSFLGCIWNLAAVEIHTAFCVRPLQALQLTLVSSPFVANHLAAFKTTHRDNHSSYLS